MSGMKQRDQLRMTVEAGAAHLILSACALDDDGTSSPFQVLRKADDQYNLIGHQRPGLSENLWLSCRLP